MRNLEVSWLFHEIADLLEVQNENPFKVRAYRKAARSIELLPSDIKEVYEKGRLREVDGLGKALADKVEEWLQTGTISYLERLRREIPPGVVEMTNIPGVGPKMAGRFFRELGITNLDELEEAAEKRQLRTLKGMGVKTEWQVLRGIAAARGEGGKTLLGVAQPLAEQLISSIRTIAGVENAAIAGSIRRQKDMVSDIDIAVAAHSRETVRNLLHQFPWVRKVVESNDEGVLLRLKSGVPVHIQVVDPLSFPLALFLTTGSKPFLQKVYDLAGNRGISFAGFQLRRRAGEREEAVHPGSEAEVFRLLGLEYIPPEIREGKGEIEAAQSGGLPRLIQWDDLKSDLHVHSSWSDGVNSIEEMALQAKANGFEFIAICDHSRSLRVANGLSVEQLQKQEEEIAALNRRLQGITVLSGIEVDILSDGSLDLPQEVLARRDFVVASIHTGFQQSGEQLTRRVLSAIENPVVDVIAHPTGRLLSRRDPYSIDMEAIIAAAAGKKKALEINASPDRLDLNDYWARRAKEAGVKIAINTDAHSTQQLEYMQFGLGTARRAWLEKEDVLNTLSINELRKWKGARCG